MLAYEIRQYLRIKFNAFTAAAYNNDIEALLLSLNDDEKLMTIKYLEIILLLCSRFNSAMCVDTSCLLSSLNMRSRQRPGIKIAQEKP